MNSHTVTRIIVPFAGYAGRYVWHCHLLEHEDNEMMRAVRGASGLSIVDSRQFGSAGRLVNIAGGGLWRQTLYRDTA